MMSFYVPLWIAITLTCIFIISIITFKVCDEDWAGAVASISALFGLLAWIFVIVFALNLINSKYKYQILLYDKIKAERNIEKHLIDYPELRELEIDEFGKIKKEKND